MGDDKPGAIVKVLPRGISPRESKAEHRSTEPIPRNSVDGGTVFGRMFVAGIGRVAFIELRSGSRISGEILAVYEEFIDTDSGIIRLADIAHARWMGAEEVSIARGGPIRPRW